MPQKSNLNVEEFHKQGWHLKEHRISVEGRKALSCGGWVVWAEGFLDLTISSGQSDLAFHFLLVGRVLS